MKVNFKFLSLLLLISIVSSSLISCKSPPEDEIMVAEDAIKSASAAGADEFSPRLFDKAQVYLQEAKMLNEHGKFDEARKKAEFAIIRAEKAEKNARRLTDAHDRSDD